MLAKRKPPVTEPRKSRPALQRPSIPYGTLLRTFALGSVAVLASIYAIVRYYSTPYQHMLVPKPAPTEVEIEYLPPPPADSK